MKRVLSLLAAAQMLVLTGPAGAWGYDGHRTIALVARAYVTPATRMKVDALLATDPDPLTAHDMASESTWADVYRSHGHRETALWHYVDQELDGSADLSAACYGHPAPRGWASEGPTQACVVDKVREFADELASPRTPLAERIKALKYLLHFVGDLHQPLHASDNHDRGGNCVLLALGGSRTANLHAYWDTAVVHDIADDPNQAASILRARISAVQATAWRRGQVTDWARETFRVSQGAAYTLGSPPGCRSDSSPTALPPAYASRARTVAAVQLSKAGVRLAEILDRSLASVVIPASARAAPASAAPVRTPAPAPAVFGRTRTPESLTCSAEADARALHGDERRKFRRICIRRRRGGR